MTKRIKLNLLFELSYLNSNFELTLGYLNLALNNSALYTYHNKGTLHRDLGDYQLAKEYIYYERALSFNTTEIE